MIVLLTLMKCLFYGEDLIKHTTHFGLFFREICFVMWT